MLTAFQKDKYGIIQRFAQNPTLKNRRALKLLLNSSWNNILKDAMIIASLKGKGADADVILYFSSILQGFPQKSYIVNESIEYSEKYKNEARIDAQAIYRQALLDFDMNPQQDQYFKAKNNQDKE